MKLKLLALLAVVPLLGSSPSNATEFDYNIGFPIGAYDVTGTLVTNCDNGCSLDNTDIQSWSFSISLDGTNINTISSSAADAEIYYSSTNGISPLNAWPIGITFVERGPGSSVLDFISGAISLSLMASGCSYTPSSCPYASGVVAASFAIFSNDSTIIASADWGWYDVWIAGCLPAACAVPSPSATPLPAALPLFATGLGAMGLLGWRRKRRVQVD